MNEQEFGRKLAQLSPENLALTLRLVTMLREVPGFWDAWNAEEKRLGRSLKVGETVQLMDLWGKKAARHG